MKRKQRGWCVMFGYALSASMLVACAGSTPDDDASTGTDAPVTEDSGGIHHADVVVDHSAPDVSHDATSDTHAGDGAPESDGASTGDAASDATTGSDGATNTDGSSTTDAGMDASSDATTSADAGSDVTITPDASSGDAGADASTNDAAPTSCVVASDCPGSDTACAQRTCTAGVCGTSNTSAGTVTPNQTAGDCQQVECNGNGGTMSVAENTDVPNDNNACTQDVCTNGVPSNPPETQGTACNQNGGTECSATGTCVQCITGTECPSGVCTAGMCVSSLCNDGMHDGSETGVDCGGGACPACASGQPCNTGTDCGSGSCVAGVCQDVLLLSQVQTRGTGGGNDEFVEIYNPTSVSVTFDTGWSVQVRSAVGTCTSDSIGVRFAGTGQVIPPHAHLLYANGNTPGYSGTTTPDATYTTGITDASDVMLVHNTVIIDALCFYFDTTTQTNLTTCSTAYTCEGTPVMNVHNNTSSTNSSASLERLPGGASGNETNTHDNASDFTVQMPIDGPRNLASAPAP